VEIRDVRIPQALEDAMSRQAQAERERQARNILGQAETEIADKFSQAALTYQNNPVALHLRAMNMLYEAIKERGSMIIVPSSAVETMGLGGTLIILVLALGIGGNTAIFLGPRRRCVRFARKLRRQIERRLVKAGRSKNYVKIHDRAPN
jgi:regulator of protease activity HflC (stomatin/prohibitin superfamily)